MNRQPQLLIVAMIIVGFAGMAHGWRTHRWLPNTAVAEAVVKLDRIPSEVGRWQATDQEIDDLELQIGEIEGYVKREYRHQDTGAIAHVLLVAGQAGPISVHPPIACFSSRGYQTVADPKVSIFQQRHRFFEADFRNSAIDDARLVRVYWAWSTGDRWQAPESPRMTFAGEASLYKLYVSESWLPTGEENEDAGASQQLMEELLPAVQSAFSSGVVPSGERS